MVESKIYFPLAEDPETLNPNNPESEKWKFKASAESMKWFLFNKLVQILYPFNKVLKTFKAATSSEDQLTPWKTKAKSNLLDSFKFLTSPPLYSEAALSKT